ncbi:dihydrolipoamide acetyltransferase family protein [Rathayibacter sp. YIM 133350]|uniref:dihydrolipoamide acetyltransferase family protein n=1 Tax=Rathayibacter sp. YIM 133350 TaxID=3131992 RepID=UPI00307D7FA5
MSTPAATTRAFLLPDLGEGLTEAGLVGWLVAVGESIRVDQPIAEVETAKSIVELPSPFAGRVIALHGSPGDTLAVGSPVLEVAADDAAEDVSEKEAYRQEERAGSGNVLIGYGTSEAAGPTRRRPRNNPLERAAAATPAAAALGVGATRSDGPVAVRSPIVRRLARDLGVDLRSVTPTGADGAVIRSDVLSAAVNGSLAARAGAGTDGDRAGENLAVLAEEPLSMLRRAVSQKLGRSHAEIPDATVWVDVDATRLWELRAAMSASGITAPSLTAFLARFALLALEDYPLLAARLNQDATTTIRFEGVNLGVAVDTDRGLLVPVVPHADRLRLADLHEALNEVASAARSGSLPAGRLGGSTFTLNNYGPLGVDGSSAIINHPEVAILGIGRILERPWVVDGAIVPRRIAQLSLVFDHRICDGGYAAGFLRRVVDAIEQPLSVYGRI